VPSHLRSKKPRVRKSQPFKLALSSPIPGRPKVFWAYGSNTNIILEFWPERHSTNLLQKGPRRSFGFDTPKKIVIYEETRPNIRALHFLRMVGYCFLARRLLEKRARVTSQTARGLSAGSPDFVRAAHSRGRGTSQGLALAEVFCFVGARGFDHAHTTRA
jgi:hypothetical protein